MAFNSIYSQHSCILCLEDYIKNIVAHRIPDAKVILYKNGKRKNQAPKERKFYMVD